VAAGWPVAASLFVVVDADAAAAAAAAAATMVGTRVATEADAFARVANEGT
jgi:hypothetical protein